MLGGLLKKPARYCSKISFTSLNDLFQVYFDHVDNMEPAPADVNRLQELIFAHFNIQDRYWHRHKLIFLINNNDLLRFGILTHCYDTFSKAEFAAITKNISEAALSGIFLRKDRLIFMIE